MNIDYSTYDISNKQRNSFVLVGYISIFFLCLLFYHSFFLSAICGLGIFFLIESYKKYMAEKRRAFLIVQFRDLLYSLSASIATGRQMTESLSEALENLKMIYKEETPMIQELKYIVKSANENRGNEEKLLINFAVRSKSEDIKNFVDVYLACRETGGNMEQVVSKASEILMDKLTIEREIKTMTAQKQFEGKIITVMPIAVVFFLNIFSPSYLEKMYITLAGRLIMTLALSGICFAYWLTMKLTKIEV